MKAFIHHVNETIMVSNHSKTEVIRRKSVNEENEENDLNHPDDGYDP